MRSMSIVFLLCSLVEATKELPLSTLSTSDSFHEV